MRITNQTINYRGWNELGPPRSTDEIVELIVSGLTNMNPNDIESNSDNIVDNFDDMQLKEELLHGIYDYNLKTSSAIQQRAIVPCVKRSDVIIRASSSKNLFF